MAAVPRIPAAQYLRMSTDDQQYSISNQRIRIQEYAVKKGFEIIKTYEDPAERFQPDVQARRKVISRADAAGAGPSQLPPRGLRMRRGGPQKKDAGWVIIPRK